MELSELEMKVIKDCIVHGFIASQNTLYLEYDSFLRDIGEGTLPRKEEVLKFFSTIRTNIASFDAVYFENLSTYPVNPLKIEQEAWTLLSRILKEHQEKYQRFIRGYSNEDVSENNRNQLATYLKETLKLLEQWTIIARSYGNKYDLSVYHNNESFKHISMEQWCKGIPEYEQGLRNLIGVLKNGRET